MNRQQRRAVRHIQYTCSNCGETTSADRARNWNCTVERGRIVGYLCPECQTPEQNLEAMVNEATIDYAVDSFGRLIGTAKTGGA